MEIFNHLTVLGGKLAGFHWPFGFGFDPKTWQPRLNESML